MKIIYTFFLLLSISNFISAQEDHCSRTTSFGTAEICLPVIDGYQECYMDPTIKEIADATEVSMNSVLGFYINDDSYDRKDSLALTGFDDYFKFYGTNEIQNLPADKYALKEMEEMLANNFLSTNWDLIEKEVDKLELQAEIGVPTVIKRYNFNDQSFTFIMLTKYEVPGYPPYTMALSMNGIVTAERMIWMAYYLTYEDEQTIARLEEKSNMILKAVFK